MSVPLWSPGTNYAPGSIVQPRAALPVDTGQPDNPSFESGDLTSWDYRVTGSIGTVPAVTTAYAFDGTHSVNWPGANGTGSEGGTEVEIINTERMPVVPGQKILAQCYIMYNPTGHQTGSRGMCRVYWYDASGDEISHSTGTLIQGKGPENRWINALCAAIAPAGAAFGSIGVWLTAKANGHGGCFADAFSWDYTFSGAPVGLVFRATQALSGYSGAHEPHWPIVVGETVVDNQVTWEGLIASRVEWLASPILVSGASEPTWPDSGGGSVVDNTIVWTTVSRRIADAKCPHSKVVAIAASKIFAADNDIIAYCATVNPLDWSTANDAGYLPFGLQTYGSTPVSALGLYRSNLMAFNSQGYQMWQVDQDPVNMAILDASPIGCPYPKSVQPANNDLVLLTAVGIRNIGIAGASTNLQAGSFGKQIDPLVLAAIRAGDVPRALYYPGAGQYWLFFGAEAFVLTMNGGPKDFSWSRYVFPAEVTDWAVLGEDLYLRAGTLVWRVDPDALVDDELEETSVGGENIEFDGYMAWPYLDFGPIAGDKMMEGFDLVVTGTCDVSFGYDQRNPALATDPYTIEGDTVPGTMVPIPIAGQSFQMRITFHGSQAWEWSATNMYINDMSPR